MKQIVQISLLAFTVGCWGSQVLAADETPTPPQPPAIAEPQKPAEQADTPAPANQAQQQADESPADDDNDETCSLASLSGNYGVQTQGVRVRGHKSYPYASVRTVTFDGKGNLTSRGMANVAGKIMPTWVDGTYSVDEDCSVTIEAKQSFGDDHKAEPYRQYGVMVDGGDAIIVLQTSSGRTQLGRYEKY
jgi:hypothetical protein